MPIQRRRQGTVHQPVSRPGFEDRAASAEAEQQPVAAAAAAARRGGPWLHTLSQNGYGLWAASPCRRMPGGRLRSVPALAGLGFAVPPGTRRPPTSRQSLPASPPVTRLTRTFPATSQASSIGSMQPQHALPPAPAPVRQQRLSAALDEAERDEPAAPTSVFCRSLALAHGCPPALLRLWACHWSHSSSASSCASACASQAFLHHL